MKVSIRLILLIIAIAILAWMAATCSYGFLRMQADDRAAEGVLRRGIEVVVQKRHAPDTIISLLPDSITHDTLALRRPYELSFVDTFPYDASSYWTFFTRSAYVWRVCFPPATLYEGEVRHWRNGVWTVWLTRMGKSKCSGGG